jgi:hypothetical protein
MWRDTDGTRLYRSELKDGKTYHYDEDGNEVDFSNMPPPPKETTEVETLQQRNIVLEQVARQHETALAKAQADITKLASLVAQLMPK